MLRAPTGCSPVSCWVVDVILNAVKDRGPATRSFTAFRMTGSAQPSTGRHAVVVRQLINFPEDRCQNMFEPGCLLRR